MTFGGRGLLFQSCGGSWGVNVTLDCHFLCSLNVQVLFAVSRLRSSLREVLHVLIQPNFKPPHVVLIG